MENKELKQWDSTYSVMNELYEIVSGNYGFRFDSKYSIGVGLLNAIEDWEISNSGKDVKTIDMHLYPNGTESYYTFTGDIASGDYLEGFISINGVIPAGTYKAFAINNELAVILTGSNFSGQAVSLVKSGNKYINK